MTEQEPLKVYELAKELGIDSISLLDKLKTLNIQVKSHMSSLTDEQLQTARSMLGARVKSKGPAKPKTAKPAVKKKAAPSTTAAPAGVTPPPAEEPSIEGAKSSRSQVIRRRVRSDGLAETADLHARAQEKLAAEINSATVLPADAQSIEEDFEEGTHIAASGDAPQVETTRPEVDSAAIAATPAESPESAGASPKEARQPTLINRPVAPARKNFLKIVEAPTPAARPVIRPQLPKPAGAKPGTPTAARPEDGARIIKMTKEKLDKLAEEEAAKKRGAGREQESVEDIRFADYKKREVIYLPKKKKIPVGKELRKTQLTTPKAQKRVIEMEEGISVQDLANQLGVKSNEVIKKLIGMGQMATINQVLDLDTASLIAGEYKYEVKTVAFKEEDLLRGEQDAPEALVARPPVVTVMGHVDHGKTSLLDALRESNVAAGEAGGITQHIGAYTIEKNGKQITFIDTPGHEAFTVMRARGANVTDIVILVVAADDGVMPQTREALSHARAAEVPIIVAVNKIDKPGANPERVKQALAELNLLAEDWGGDTMFIPVSATMKTNLDQLLEAILLNAEVLELKSNPNARASGTVLEARLEKGRGPVISVLVSRGTLHIGDPLVSGAYAGKVRALIDHKGAQIRELKPGMAAEVLGMEGVPNAGDPFDVPANDADAKEIIAHRSQSARTAEALKAGAKMSLDQLFAKIQSGDTKELKAVLKTDVYGSLEAIRDSLTKISTEKAKVTVIHAGTGGITESDVLLASASQAVIIGFNVRPETKARQLAEAEHVEVKSYSIIYELLDDVKKALTGLLDKKKVEKFLGRAEVRQTFSVPKIGTIAGCSVVDGKILRGANVRLLRNNVVVYDGRMSSLKRFKDDVREVASGYECGIGIENYNDLKQGDIIEAYQIDMVAQELDANAAQS